MAELHDDCYAYKAMHKYPIHTKQAALDSYKEYVNQMDKIPEDRCALINEAFVKAAAVHGIKYPDVFSDHKPVRKTVSFDLADGTHIEMSKIASDDDVKKVRTYITTHRTEMPYEAVKKMALYACQQGQDMDIPDEDMKQLQKYAGLGVGDKEEMLDQFLKRSSLINLNDESKSKFFKLYKDMDKEDESLIMKKASQMASMLDAIDNLYGLRSEYGKYIKAPEEACFKTSVDDLYKEASDYLHVDSTDTVLSKEALLEKRAQIDKFLEEKYGYKADNNEALLEKVASLNPVAISALIDILE